MKPRDERALLGGSKSSTSCGRSSAAVPGIMTFLQNPPPITINGQFIGTSIYQMTVQSVNLQEIYDWAPQADGQDADAAGIRRRAAPTCRSPARR